MTLAVSTTDLRMKQLTIGILLSTKFFADVFNIIMFWGIRMWRVYSWLPDFPEILHVELDPADFESQMSLL